MILELYTPFRGLLRISSAPILEALSQDGTLRPEALQITCRITSDTHWDWYICEGHMITVCFLAPREFRTFRRTQQLPPLKPRSCRRYNPSWAKANTAVASRKVAELG